MKILLAVQRYEMLTGSEIYVYELAKTLKARKHDVTIMSFSVGGKIAEKTHQLGIKTYKFFDHPDLKFDVMHLNQPRPTAYCLSVFHKTPAVVTIHSQFTMEKPFKDKWIRKYVAVRPKIQEMYRYLKPELIYNGFDLTRFNKDGVSSDTSILFVGNLDVLRYQVIMDLVKKSQLDQRPLTLVGDNYRDLPGELINHYPAMWNTETITKGCGETAGIFMGRSTIEGWLCGKNAWIYDVDQTGKILNLTYEKPPTDMKHFDIEYMTDKFEDIYKSL